MLGLKELLNKYGIAPKGIIQSGSHEAQELDIFLECGFKKIALIEPNEKSNQVAKEKIKSNPNIILYEIAVGNEVGVKEMYIETANNGQSNSFLKPLKHIEMYPHITFNNKEIYNITKIDILIQNKTDFNVLYIDNQGFELETLKGAIETLKQIDCIFTEVNFVEMYENCVLVNELDEFLLKQGFERVETGGFEFYNNAFYVRGYR